ncbi:hypothetical protein TNCV_2762781 [Trichonephila clavipes]|nr:hypothetical protein TNCV_2762781 [Trichonephila clavipes]
MSQGNGEIRNSIKSLREMINLREVVTSKCLGSPPVDRDRRNAHPGFSAQQSGSKIQRHIKAELAGIHLTYRAAEYNGRKAQWLYAQRYPRKETPSHAFLALLPHRLSDSVSFILHIQEVTELDLI